jgi:hypothetical protein
MQNICEDGYQGDWDQIDLEEYEEIKLTTDRLDDDSIVVNFDLFDTDQDQVTKTGGYVHIRQDNEDKKFYVTVYNAAGDVLSETLVPFNFEE